MLQRSARGSLILMSAQMLSTLISAVGTILVARFLGDTSYGMIFKALVPVNIAMLFRDVGVSSAITRYTSQLRHEGKRGHAYSILKTGIGINLLMGILLSVIVFISAGYIDDYIYSNNHNLKILIQIASADILGMNLMTTSKAVFAGYERMELHSSLTLIYSVLRSVLSPLLVYYGFGPVGAMIGHTAPIIFTGALGVAIVLSYFLGPLDMGYQDAGETILKYGWPLFLSGILGGAMTQIYNFLVTVYAETDMVGNYSAATNFGVLVQFFTMPIATTLFPLFSKLDYRAGEALKTVYQQSVKYVSLITIPIVIGMAALSEQIINIVYPGYDMASWFLTLYSINFLFIGMGSLGLGNLLNSQDKTDVNFRGTIYNVVFSIPLAIILIPRWGVTGLLISRILTKPGFFRNIWWTWKNMEITPDWTASAKIYISAAAAYFSTSLLLRFFHHRNSVEFIAGGVLLVLVYTTGIILLRVIDVQDLENLRSLTRGLGPLAPLFNFLLDVLRLFLHS